MHPPVQQSSPHNPSPFQHNYGTRIRKNSVLKPSARLRQSPPSPHPAPRKIRPVPVPASHRPNPPSSDPCFPLPNVMLHPEDASNKVFHAIGRSFLSVENRAMTIKDLAEMTLKYGLMCQNVSAASQAITTYIRNHMARCESQQDHPLLLRHVLSGTPADDDLVPALYSRVGGATNSNKSNAKDSGAPEKQNNQVVPNDVEGERLTNFRRGTMVWYLSKAAGVPCPFARAGIRQCEYGKEGKKVAAESVDESPPRLKKHSKQDDAQCGEKRKRLRRGCRRNSDGCLESTSYDGESWSPANDSDYGELSADSSDDERPPKVKLTLRLKPSASKQREVIDLANDVTTSSEEEEEDDDDDDEGDGVDVEMHFDQPEVPWSLPPYPRRSIAVPGYTPSYDNQSYRPPIHSPRSPSLPWSASPPPDSDHDDLDSDFDWDSSSLSLPSPAIQVKVESVEEHHPFKLEPTDIRDMLDAWEDFDCAPVNPSTVSSATVKLPTTDDLRFDTLELWEWEFESGWSGVPDDNQDLPVVKIEPDERESLVLLRSFAASPCSPCTSSNSSLSSFSESGVGSLQSPTIHPAPAFRSSASPSLPPSSYPIRDARDGALTWQDAELLGPDSVHPHEFEDWANQARTHIDCHSPSQQHPSPHASVDFLQERRQVSPAEVKETPLCSTQSESQASPSPSDIAAPDSIVVHTCRPCAPEVCATQIEGISVYQTTLGSNLLLRRIDTDFVNLSTILCYTAQSPPSPLSHACVNVSHPSPFINGIWAPLSVARLFAHGLSEGIESIFLSDDLVMRFPTALQEFYAKSASGRSLNQFGPPFTVPLSSPRCGNPLLLPQCDRMQSEKDVAWETPADAGHVEEPLLAIPSSFDLALAVLQPLASTQDITTEIPLSPTEQEMFHALCVHPDWEVEEPGTTDDGEKVATDSSLPKQKPLRRSRRVADAVAARTRVVPPRTKGFRHS